MRTTITDYMAVPVAEVHVPAHGLEHVRVFYHATPASRLAYVLRDGLLPGGEATGNAHHKWSGWTTTTDVHLMEGRDWCVGKVFLASSALAAAEWQQYVADACCADAAIVAIDGASIRGRIYVDGRAARDGIGDSYYVLEPIAPEWITVHDYGVDTWCVDTDPGEET